MQTHRRFDRSNVSRHFAVFLFHSPTIGVFGYTFSSRTTTPQFTAAEQTEIDKFLAENAEFGGDVKAVNEDGITLLHRATLFGSSIAVVKFLISKGADVNAKEEDGYTPLHFAAVEGYTENAKFLVSKGADVNAKTNAGYT